MGEEETKRQRVSTGHRAQGMNNTDPLLLCPPKLQHRRRRGRGGCCRNEEALSGNTAEWLYNTDPLLRRVRGGCCRICSSTGSIVTKIFV